VEAARERGDLPAYAVSRNHEERIDEVLRADLGLAHEGTQALGAAEPAEAAFGEAHGVKDARLFVVVAEEELIGTALRTEVAAHGPMATALADHLEADRAFMDPPLLISENELVHLADHAFHDVWPSIAQRADSIEFP
jgi:hypothetical protein